MLVDVTHQVDAIIEATEATKNMSKKLRLEIDQGLSIFDNTTTNKSIALDPHTSPTNLPTVSHCFLCCTLSSNQLGENKMDEDYLQK